MWLTKWPAVLSLACLLLFSSCRSESRPSSQPSDSEVAETTTLAPTTVTSPSALSTTVIVEFASPQSVSGWSSIDDSVMGGISRSTSTWTDSDGSGALLFSGRMTTEQNGGFTSTFGPVDSSLGQRAKAASALGVRAIGDGRTYVLQLRSGTSGQDRWIARFTPSVATDGTLVEIPIGSFTPVNRFLRPTIPSTALDPSTILQIGFYLVDEQVGDFRLAVHQIAAIS